MIIFIIIIIVALISAFVGYIIGAVYWTKYLDGEKRYEKISKGLDRYWEQYYKAIDKGRQAAFDKASNDLEKLEKEVMEMRNETQKEMDQVRTMLDNLKNLKNK